MSDRTKDYSLCDTLDCINLSLNNLASAPKPAPRTIPRSLTAHRLKEREGEDEPTYQQLNTQPMHLFQSKQQNYFIHPTNTLPAPHQYRPCQPVKPCTSESRRDNPLPQPYPIDQERFMEKVAAKLQALKNDSASNSLKYKFDMPICQAERGHEVLDDHFNNHFSNNHKSSRSLKKGRNELTKRTANPIKAYCTYVEFDGAKKTETASYLIKPRSNTLYDLKRALPSRSEGCKLFFKNQDNILEQADYDEQQLHTSRHKDGSDTIICEIVVPKVVVPRLCQL